VASGFGNVTYDCIWPMMEDPNLDSLMIIGGVGMSAMIPRMGADHINAVVKGSDNPGMLLDIAQQIFDFTAQQELLGLDKLFESMEKYKKPVILATPMNESIKQSPVYQKLKKHGIMLYGTPERAATVIAKLVEYSRYLSTASEI
jgi:hypothetical protein